MCEIKIVGMGPGDPEHMTLEAVHALEWCDVIVGYTVYTDLLKGQYPEKEFLHTPMRREEERCHLAFREALSGKKVCMVCSGDAGVYGMAALMYETGAGYPEAAVTVVSGVTAALSGAAALGAPVGHDFCVISLSDLLTPWEKIEKRLLLASEADLVICLYNPASRKRADHLRRACSLMLRYKSPETVCGYVRNIARDGEEKKLLTLQKLKEEKVDMFTTVFIGNSETKNLDGYMVTPRGYRGEGCRA